MSEPTEPLTFITDDEIGRRLRKCANELRAVGDAPAWRLEIVAGDLAALADLVDPSREDDDS